MSPKTLTVFTSDHDASRILRKKVQIVMVLTPSPGIGKHQAWTALAWKTWTFQAHGLQFERAQLQLNCFIDVAISSGGSFFGRGAHAGLGADQYLAYTEDQVSPWEIHKLTNASERVMVINKSPRPQDFLVGFLSFPVGFEPLITLAELNPLAAIMFQIPSIIQVYAIEDDVSVEVSQILGSIESSLQPLLPPTALSELDDDVYWHLFTAEDGRIVLKEVTASSALSSIPPVPPSVPQSPGFLGCIMSPAYPSPPSPPSPPLSFGSPGFLGCILAPPAIILPEPPSIPLGLDDPGFMFSPLLLPQAASDDLSVVDVS
ncbi:hypothetical protein BXZ70DRAFT_1007319 [Cristinia sonorae]|uniref:Uncharacterized protein n=1 Tax=Cristinia sonorae TaxID=1940300 RepID=A0A8K0XQJ3_9AGAR|nr:hypothetical protein BXZ70DRAFT_1007319 [Cristinia sonorae]